MTRRRVQSFRLSRFTRSVNLEEDLSAPDALSGYLITSGVRRALQRVAVRSERGTLNRAITLTGPYGTGKSAFALFCSQLMAPTWWPHQSRARQLLHQADTAIERAVFGRGCASHDLLPVVVTGSREPLATAIVRALATSLSSVKGSRIQKHAMAVKWLLHKPGPKRAIDGRTVCELLSESVSFAGQGKQRFGGLLLILDELGKLLEYATAHPTDSDVFILQSIAEFAVRCETPFLVLGILHQDFAVYSGHLAPQERAEWEKVRGRFEDTTFEEPADEILRLVAEARGQSESAAPSSRSKSRSTHCAEAELPGDFSGLVGAAVELNVAPGGVSKSEFADLLIRCAPLHPLVAVMLGPIFRKVAQNERSVFSFLESGEPNGLRDYAADPVRAPSDLYRTDRLYDYFMTSVGPGLYGQPFGKRWAEIDSVLAGLADPTSLDVFLVKTIGLLNVLGQLRHLRASRDVLCFAASGLASAEEVDDRLKWLQVHSAIVYRRYNSSFALWEGSDIDIDDLVKTAAARVARTTSIAALAEKYAPSRPLVARRHSFETGTLRFFNVRFATPETTESVAAQPFGDADGTVLVILPEQPHQLNTAIDVASSSRWRKQPQVLFAVATDPSGLAAALQELAVLSWVQKNTLELAGDATARRELRTRIASTKQRVEDAFHDMLAPYAPANRQCRWFHRGEERRLTTQRSLNEELSRICRSVFAKSPRIRNELINRRDLSSAAAAARRNLIEAMITRCSQAELGIAGTPPEKSMYLSLLAASGIHRPVKGGSGYGFAAPMTTADAGLRAAWVAIEDFFGGCEGTAHNLRELIRTLQEPPFGMKSGPIPVLVCAAMLAMDGELAFYEEGTFVPQMSTSVFERLLKAPHRFTVQRWRIDGIRTSIFDRLAELLIPGDEPSLPASGQMLAVVRPLCQFAGSLNDFSRNTSSVSTTARGIRDVLLSATKPDQLLFVELPAACGVGPFDVGYEGDESAVEQFIVTLKLGLERVFKFGWYAPSGVR